MHELDDLAALLVHYQQLARVIARERKPRRAPPGRLPGLVFGELVHHGLLVIVQADPFNRSRLQSVIVAMMTTNLKRGEAPGNFTLTPAQSGLPRDSVVNVSQLFTVDKSVLTELVGSLPVRHLKAFDDGLKLVLGL